MRFDYFAAVIVDGDVYCTGCLATVQEDRPEHQRLTADSPEVTPIFPGDEWDHYPTCDACHEEHDYVTLTEEGLVWRAKRTDAPALAPFLMDGGKKLRRYSEVGCYALVYLDEDGELVCPVCAEKQRLEDGSYRPVRADVLWEAPPGGEWPECAACLEPLEVSYAPAGRDTRGRPLAAAETD